MNLAEAIEHLATARLEAETALAAAGSLAEVDEVERTYLGKRSVVTGVNEAIKGFDASERPEAGKAIGAYRAASGGREQYYSDGLVGVSVFQWHGSLKPGSLPAGGTYGTPGRPDARVYESPVGEVAVWDANGRTYAVVSEATPAETARIVAALPKDGSDDAPTRIGRFLIGPFTWR